MTRFRLLLPAGLWLAALVVFEGSGPGLAHQTVVIPLSLSTLLAAAGLLGWVEWRRALPATVGLAIGSLTLIAAGAVAWGVWPMHFFSMRHWTIWAAPVLIIGLLRWGGVRAAGLLTGSLCAVVCVVGWARGFHDPLAYIGIVLPVGATFVLGVAATNFHQRALARGAEDQAAADGAILVEAEAAAVSAAAAVRRTDLARAVRPLLAALAVSDNVGPELRARASAAAQELRDGLRARHLVTPQIRGLLARARAAGVVVTVIDDRPEPADDSASELARRCIAASLPEVNGGEVTYRVSGVGRLTCVVTGLPNSRLTQIAARLGEVGGLVVVTDEALLAQVE